MVTQIRGPGRVLSKSEKMREARRNEVKKKKRAGQEERRSYVKLESQGIVY